MSAYPKAYVVKSSRNPSFLDHRLLTVDCPLCPKQHTHGNRAGERGDLGHRVAHCIKPYDPDGPGGYVIWDESPVRPWEQSL